MNTKSTSWINNISLIIGRTPPTLIEELDARSNGSVTADSRFACEIKQLMTLHFEAAKLFLAEGRRPHQNFTLHDITHSMNVVDFMGQLFKDLSQVSSAELSILIYAALFHDIGMVKLANEIIDSNEIREEHGERSELFLQNRVIICTDNRPISFGAYDSFFMNFLPSICASHMRNLSTIEKIRERVNVSGLEVNLHRCAVLLRLADAMDIRSNRAPYELFGFLTKKEISESHWKKHMSIYDCGVKNGRYFVDGSCDDELCHRCLYQHIDMIESEIDKLYRWKLGLEMIKTMALTSHVVERNIDAHGYVIWHQAMSMDYRSILNLFMGEHLYGDKRLGLREILQNSIDACLIRTELTDKSTPFRAYTPIINIIFDSISNQVVVKDNGTGMDYDILVNYFMNVGNNYYGSHDFKKLKLSVKPTGFFGIGFFSCFMLSDEVIVKTRRYNQVKGHVLRFSKNDRFVTIKEDEQVDIGTEIILNYNSFSQIFIQHQNSDRGTEKNEDIYGMVQSYIESMFWKLSIHNGVGGLRCELITDDFVKYAKCLFEEMIYGIQNPYKHNHTLVTKKKKTNECYDYIVDVSKYLIGVTGIIVLKDSQLMQLFLQLKSGNRSNILDALKNGDATIDGTVRQALPFADVVWYCKSRDKYERLENTHPINSISISSIILVCMSGGKKKTRKNDKCPIDCQVCDHNEWHCVLLSQEINHLGYGSTVINCSPYPSIYQLKYNGELSKIKIFNEEFNNEKHHYYIIPHFEDDVFSVHLSCSLDRERTVPIDLYYHKRETIWLKDALIKSEAQLVDNDTCYLNVVFESLCIDSDLIQPTAARDAIIASSDRFLKTSVKIAVYLWIYEQLESSPKAKSTLKAIEKELERLYDPENPLLCHEMFGCI